MGVIGNGSHSTREGVGKGVGELGEESRWEAERGVWGVHGGRQRVEGTHWSFARVFSKVFGRLAFLDIRKAFLILLR